MTVSLTEPMTVRTTLAADLLLARLLPPTKAQPKPTQVRNDVSRFFREPVTDETWQDLIDGLVNMGLLTARPLGLTEAGRSRALEFLGISELPAKCHWKDIRVQFLLPKALGFAPTAAESQKRIKRPENLAALLIKRRFELAGRDAPALGKTLEALVCHELGFSEATTLTELKKLVLSRMIGSETPLDAKALHTTFPRLLLGAKTGGVTGLCDVLLDGWADAAPSPLASVPSSAPPPTPVAVEEPVPAEFDLPAFAATVQAVARDCPTGRFGDNKVFINHLWRHLRDEPSFPALDLPTFKEKLVAANSAGLLTLSRADLVQVMDPADVQESETRYLNGEFHFVLVTKEQP